MSHIYVAIAYCIPTYITMYVPSCILSILQLEGSRGMPPCRKTVLKTCFEIASENIFVPNMYKVTLFV